MNSWYVAINGFVCSRVIIAGSPRQRAKNSSVLAGIHFATRCSQGSHVQYGEAQRRITSFSRHMLVMLHGEQISLTADDLSKFVPTGVRIERDYHMCRVMMILL